MKALRSCFMRYSAGACLLIAGTSVHALNTQITLQADSEVTPTNSEVVTFGLPIAEGEVTDISDIKVMNGSQEISAYVESGLRYHWSDNSIRSVTIQVQNIDMTGGNVTLTIDDTGATTVPLSELAHSEGWATAGADKNNLSYPRIFALHDKGYLADSGLISPYAPSIGSSDEFEQYQVGQFESWAGGLNFGSSSGANWLFDRSSAMYKAYMTTGRIEFLKEAFLSKQFYFSHIRNDGTSPAKSGGNGCFTYGGVACADGKYIAPQQAKLTWALTGDDSQWDSDLIVDMAMQSDLGWNQYATRDSFDSENEGFTERGAGMAGLAEIAAYEMTGNATILSHLNERIDSLKDMQQTEKSWDVANDWTPKSGGFSHNIGVHEGMYNEGNAPTGDSSQRGFSAWMTENIVDFLWQAYWVTGNSNAPEMLRRIAVAVETYGFTSSYNSTTGQYIRKEGYTGNNRTQSCNTTGAETDLLYMASAHAPLSSRTSNDWWPYYSDTHNIETVLTLGVGYYFETDDNIRTMLASRIQAIIDGWVNANCSNVYSGVYRLFNWQHRSNSIRTWQWVAEQSGIDMVTPVTPVNSLPLPPGSFVAQMLSIDNGTGDSGSGSTGDSGSGSAGDSGSGSAGDSDSGGTGDSDSGSTGDSGSGSTGDSGSDGTSDSGSGSVEGSGSDNVIPVFVASAACTAGNDPHWQCAGQWTDFSDVVAGDYIAICVGAEGASYSDCSSNDAYVLYSNVASSDGFMVCSGEVALGSGRGSCNVPKYVRQQNFGSIDSVAATSEDTGDTGVGSELSDGSSSSGETVVPPVAEGTGLIFTDVTSSVIDSLHSVDTRFWAGMPDVNGDGCFDIFVGTHSDNIDSAMYLQDRVQNECQGTFSYLDNSNNYTQASPVSPRITGRYAFGNWTGHKDGLWSFWGTDVDGNAAAIYQVSESTNIGGNPNYEPKASLCASVSRCWMIDSDGDGNLEVINSDRDLEILRRIVDVQTGEVIHQHNNSGNDYHHLVFDTNNDSYPDIVNVQSGSTWRYNPNSSQFDLISNTHASNGNATPNHSLALDYDLDGDTDFMTMDGSWLNDGIAQWHLHRNDGGTFTEVTNGSGLDVMNFHNEDYWTIYANAFVSDINLDGFPDILFAGSSYGRDLHIIINNGDGTFSKWEEQDFGGGGNSGGKAWVYGRDYDNDGDIDLVKADDAEGSMRLWRNDSSLTNNWLRARVVGLGDNTDGLHARLIIRNPENDQIVTSYEIQHQQGNAGLIPHMGVGQLSSVNVQVIWPHNGGSETISNVSVNKDVIIYRSGGYSDYSPGHQVGLSK